MKVTKNKPEFLPYSIEIKIETLLEQEALYSLSKTDVDVPEAVGKYVEETQHTDFSANDVRDAIYKFLTFLKREIL